MFNPNPRIETIAIAPGFDAFVIDDALTDPERWVTLAAEHQTDFATLGHNAYPGVELRMPDAVSARLDLFFAQHIRARLGARRTLRMYSRLSLATLQPDALAPRQWICHRDRLDTAPDRVIAACVLYLFHDASLGGTAFFTPKRSDADTALLLHESGTLDAEAFARKYDVQRNYQTASTAWFEKTASIPPRFNRLVFYNGGDVFHCSDIDEPARLSDNPTTGRLTLNGFFVCSRAAA